MEIRLSRETKEFVAKCIAVLVVCLRERNNVKSFNETVDDIIRKILHE